MKYARRHFKRDLTNPEMLHIKSKERFIAFYEHLGKTTNALNQQMTKHRMKFIKPKGKILELGCHVGFNAIYYATLLHEVTGVDISSTLLMEAERRKSELPEEIANKLTFINSDILDLDVDKLGKFDTLILTETLEHVIDPVAILEKSKQFMHNFSTLYVSAPKKRVGNFSHVRGIPEDWLMDTGNKIGIDFKVVPHKKLTLGVGMLK